ncbi:trypsin-like serine protease [Streptomyces sp. NPDC053048]|uniref:trypsin-like serine protease n=1 Tax=Streptomyces sp. NPDC053048 TaxID=3365694 RepID=UPI0037D767CA
MTGTFLVGPVPQAGAIDGGAEAARLRGAAQVWLDNGSGTRNFICTASVIDHRWVLTAKHCITNAGNPAPGRFWIRAGNLALGKGERRQVDGYRVTAVNDLALFRLAKPLNSSITVNSLVSRGFLPSSGSDLSLSGWGYTDPRDTTPAPKLKVCSMNVERVDLGDPSWIWATSNNGHNLRGDSGGPVLLGSTQIGIISAYIDLTAQARIVPLGNPEIRDWIRHHTGV